MKVHLIAIGGAIMHNLAIALKRHGYSVSGSDDAIYDPAKTNLENEDLLPAPGWDASKISEDLDFIILGMHARVDNPELLKAKELNLKIVSFPEFIANHSKDKKRVVVAGSHGKTSTTSMIMHVLRKLGMDFDYLVGAKIQDFELSVKLSDAPLILIEGDEYLSSPIDRRSKFLWYKPHISIITGIAWDHINVFPTFEGYLQTFRDFIDSIVSEGVVFWFEEDQHLQKMFATRSQDHQPYGTPRHHVVDGDIFLDGHADSLTIFGKHNLQNLESAYLVCDKLGIEKKDFVRAISDFKGAGKRLELIQNRDGIKVFRDFAHAPSKLAASVKAVKEYQTKNKLVAVFELHTFSSLNEKFLPHYQGTMDLADRAIVFYDEHVFEHRKMDLINAETIKSSFGNVEIFNNPDALRKLLDEEYDQDSTILLMSSGNFKGMDISFA